MEENKYEILKDKRPKFFIKEDGVDDEEIKKQILHEGHNT